MDYFSQNQDLMYGSGETSGAYRSSAYLGISQGLYSGRYVSINITEGLKYSASEGEVLRKENWLDEYFESGKVPHNWIF